MTADDEYVVITTRDIYALASQTAGKVDAVLAMVTASQTTDADHEARLRRLETRFYGVVGTLGLAATSLIVWTLTQMTGSGTHG